MPPPNPSLLSALARSFLAGEPGIEAIVARAAHLLGRHWNWLEPLAQRYLQTFAAATRPPHRDVVRFFRRDHRFQQVCSKHADLIRIEHWLTEPPQMQPVAAAATWDIPAIETVGGLAQWLSLTPAELDWFANLRASAQHYHYRVLTKSPGSTRLIEAPKPRLKELQHQILAGLLEKVPPHTAAHGFLKAAR